MAWLAYCDQECHELMITFSRLFYEQISFIKYALLVLYTILTLYGSYRRVNIIYSYSVFLAHKTSALCLDVFKGNDAILNDTINFFHILVITDGHAEMTGVEASVFCS